MNTCVTYDAFGSPHDVLKVISSRKESPKEGEVLVRMIASPINPSDLIPITGAYSHRIALPDIPGYEGVGIIEEVGQAVSKERIGKRVLPLRGEGTWQELVTAPADWVVPVPEEIDDDTAAQLYINPVTAWIICTETLRLGPGDVLLVNACGSAIGRLFAQLAKVIGFRLIAVTRDERHTQELLALGASAVIQTNERQVAPAVLELTHGKGAYAAIDSIGGEEGTELAFCVRPNGLFLTLGLLSGKQVDWAKINRETRATVKLFHLRHWNQQVSVQAWHETFHQLISMIANGSWRLMRPGAYCRLQDVREAVQAAASAGRTSGKIFLVP